MKVLGVGISYLECGYGTKCYIIDQVNGQINAIHDDSLELTEFTGHFSPFNLDKLEQEVCRLADQEDKDVFSAPQQPPKQQIAPQAQDSDMNSGLQSIDNLTGMGFCSPNYIPIPQVRNTNQQQPRISVPTSIPIADLWLDLNTSDLTHNRGKAKIIDSFTESHKPPKKSSKGDKIKSSQGVQHKNEPQLSTSSQTPLKWQMEASWFIVQHVEEITRGRTAIVTLSAQNVGPDHITQICAAHLQKLKKVNICIYCGSKNHSSGRVHQQI